MRGALALVAMGLVLVAGASDVRAQAFPTRPIKILVGFTPGTAADVATRVVAPKLGELLGQSVVIENKPGASSNIAADAVVHAPPDGYTLFMGTISNTINASLIKDVPYDFATDLAPVALVSTVPNLVVVHPSLGVDSVEKLVALAKAKPGQITYGSAGVGTILHLSGELFNTMAGVKLAHVPYKGSSQAMADLLGGQISMMFAPVSTALPHIKANKIVGLAATSAQRSPAVPELPTMIELGFAGYETGVWCGLLAPKGTPPDIVAQLAAAVARATASPEVKANYAAQGVDVLQGGPDVMARYIHDETAKWARVIEASGARAD